MAENELARDRLQAFAETADAGYAYHGYPHAMHTMAADLKNLLTALTENEASRQEMEAELDRFRRPNARNLSTSDPIVPLPTFQPEHLRGLALTFREWCHSGLWGRPAEAELAARQVETAYAQIVALTEASRASDVGRDADEEEAYQIGKRDGYESAVQDIDMRTGGDGEYFASTFPGEGCPDAPTMIQRIVDRFAALSAPSASGYDEMLSSVRASIADSVAVCEREGITAFSIMLTLDEARALAAPMAQPDKERG